jgi:hypothetical protein
MGWELAVMQARLAATRAINLIFYNLKGRFQGRLFCEFNKTSGWIPEKKITPGYGSKTLGPVHVRQFRNIRDSTDSCYVHLRVMLAGLLLQCFEIHWTI